MTTADEPKFKILGAPLVLRSRSESEDDDEWFCEHYFADTKIGRVHIVNDPKCKATAHWQPKGITHNGCYMVGRVPLEIAVETTDRILQGLVASVVGDEQ